MFLVNFSLPTRLWKVKEQTNTCFIVVDYTCQLLTKMRVFLSWNGHDSLVVFFSSIVLLWQKVLCCVLLKIWYCSFVLPPKHVPNINRLLHISRISQYSLFVTSDGFEICFEISASGTSSQIPCFKNVQIIFITSLLHVNINHIYYYIIGSEKTHYSTLSNESTFIVAVNVQRDTDGSDPPIGEIEEKAWLLYSLATFFYLQ